MSAGPPSHDTTAESGRPPGTDDPPAGPPWDSAIDEAPLAFVDLEMTGLDLAGDRVIELCVERWHGRVLEDRIETLVNPGPETRFHTHVHGIDLPMLEGAPPFDAVADRVVALCRGAILVAHGASWDVAFLDAELSRVGRQADFAFYLDTLILSRRALLAASHSLGALASQLGIAQHGAHRAGDDVRVLREIFDRLTAELKPTTPRDLWHVRVGQKLVRPDLLEACARFAENGEVVEIYYRPSRKPPRRIKGIVCRVRTDLDPPRVMGYALPDRGRFELRADRILWAGSLPRSGPDTKAR